jgi:hypothetical protein
MRVFLVDVLFWLTLDHDRGLGLPLSRAGSTPFTHTSPSHAKVCSHAENSEENKRGTQHGSHRLGPPCIRHRAGCKKCPQLLENIAHIAFAILETVSLMTPIVSRLQARRTSPQYTMWPGKRDDVRFSPADAKAECMMRVFLCCQGGTSI